MNTENTIDIEAPRLTAPEVAAKRSMGDLLKEALNRGLKERSRFYNSIYRSKICVDTSRRNGKNSPLNFCHTLTAFLRMRISNSPPSRSSLTKL